MTPIRIALPTHLRTLSGAHREIRIEVDEPVTIRRVLDGIEDRYPMLRGTIRDHGEGERRAFIRFFACAQDLSNEPLNTELPPAVLSGEDVFRVVGAIAGG